MRCLLAAFVICAVSAAHAEDPRMKEIVEGHVLPGYEALAVTAEALNHTAQADCVPSSTALQKDYHEAFDAWVGVSHLRFGPSETDNRAFALAFWPDPRGSTPKALAGMIAKNDPAVKTAEEFQTVSVAARGFYALELLLFDTRWAQETDYTCSLIQAVTRDIADTADAIRNDWRAHYAALLITAGNDTYQTHAEASQQLFTALLTGLEFTADTRLGRPMGTFDRPRPKRAEAWRSQRSLRHVIVSLEATRPLAALLSGDNPDIETAYERALVHARELGDPIFANVVEPERRLKVEILQQRINTISTILTERVGPSLGITAGFNAMDGD